ncbi:MAG: hypothetical protein QW757_02470 [Candidatus Woesearchaeota archaeon]
MKKKEKNLLNNEKNLFELFLIDYISYFIIYFLIVLPLLNFFLAIKMAFIFTTIFVLPFMLFINEKSFLQTFIHRNIISMTYGSIFIIFDVVFKFKLNDLVYILTSAVFFILSILFAKK